MKSNLISKSETTALLKKISQEWNMEFPKMKNVRVHQILDDAQIITGNGLKILKYIKLNQVFSKIVKSIIVLINFIYSL